MKTFVLEFILSLLFGGMMNPFHSVAPATKSPIEHVSLTKKLDDDPRPIRGTIRKPSLAALPGAEVDLYTSTNTYVATVYSNVAGWYEFSPVAPGSYQLRISADDYRDTTVNVTVSTNPVMQDVTMTDE